MAFAPRELSLGVGVGQRHGELITTQVRAVLEMNKARDMGVGVGVGTFVLPGVRWEAFKEERVSGPGRDFSWGWDGRGGLGGWRW